MKWEEFSKMHTYEPEYVDLIETTIECPTCGKNLYYRSNVVLTSYPAKYQYECVSCGFVGYSFAKWIDNISI